MKNIRKLFDASPSVLAELRQVRVICSAQKVDRMGEAVIQAGIDLVAYRTNPVVLWQHDPAQPIARAIEISIKGGCLQSLVQFPPIGTSAKADEIYGLVCAGVVNATSIGFDPVTMSPADASNPRGPQVYSAVELAEFSFVSIPAVRGALVLEKSAHRRAISRRSALLRLRLAEAAGVPATAKRTRVLTYAEARATVRRLSRIPARAGI